MSSLALSRHLEVPRIGSHADAPPSRMVEYGYYAVVLYGFLAPGLGIHIPLFAAGMLLILAGVCVMKAGARAAVLYAPLKLPFALALSSLFLDVMVHDGSITSGTSRSFLTWAFTLTIVQSLSARRGFLHRYVVVLWVMGLATLPFLKGGAGTEMARFAADRTMISGDLANANGLGSWFGFCCLYFAIIGIETRRNGVRAASTLAAVLCLFVLGLTVSRGALLGTALGITIAFRRILRRGFIPLLLCVLLGGLSYGFGMFDGTISRYSARGTEETGRFLVWPAIIERILRSPWVGVGSDNIVTYVPEGNHFIAPHNTFLEVALSGGVLPLAFLVVWWIGMARNALESGDRPADGPFRLPLLAFVLVAAMFADLAFMEPWAVVSLFFAMNARSAYGARRLVVRRPGSGTPARALRTIRATPPS